MKRILAGFLLCAMIFSFVGCGSNEDISVEQMPFSEDQVLFVAQDQSGDVYAYNCKGELLNSPDSSLIMGCYAGNGLAPALDQSTYKVGYVDKDGVFQIEPKFDDAASFSENGVALVKINTKVDGIDISRYGYIDENGKEITPCIYSKATSIFDCGYAYAYTAEDKKHYVLDEKGNTVIEMTDKAILAVYKGYFVCHTEEGNAIYDYTGHQIALLDKGSDINHPVTYEYKKDAIYQVTYELMDPDTYLYHVAKRERFNGKNFVEEKTDYEITAKRVATTQTGWGFGIVEKDTTVIPFEYDEICSYGDYFVAIKYTGDIKKYNQVIDIYDKNYNKTAEDIEYAFSKRDDAYGQSCQLPNGYFQIEVEDAKDNSSGMFGIIDYTGKIIVEPIYSNGIGLYTYEGTGVFD